MLVLQHAVECEIFRSSLSATYLTMPLSPEVLESSFRSRFINTDRKKTTISVSFKKDSASNRIKIAGFVGL